MDAGAPTTAAAARAPRAFRSPVAWMTLVFVLAVGLASDLGSKSWAFQNVAGRPVILDRERLLEEPEYNPIPWHQPMHVLPAKLLDFRLVINRGAVFGIGKDKRFFFIVFTVIAIGVGAFLFARWTTARHHLAHVAIGMILAGGLGNLYDRWQFGVVRDFLHMLPDRRLPFGWKWWGGSPDIFPWVFNGADVLLLSGMLLLMIHINRLERKKKGAADPATVTATAPPAAISAPAMASSADTPSSDSAT